MRDKVRPSAEDRDRLIAYRDSRVRTLLEERLRQMQANALQRLRTHAATPVETEYQRGYLDALERCCGLPEILLSELEEGN